VAARLVAQSPGKPGGAFAVIVEHEVVAAVFSCYSRGGEALDPGCGESAFEGGIPAEAVKRHGGAFRVESVRADVSHTSAEW
jgi:hypothetical protein